MHWYVVSREVTLYFTLYESLWVFKDEMYEKQYVEVNEIMVESTQNNQTLNVL